MTIIKGCVACYIDKKILKFKVFAIFSNFSAFTLKKIYNSRAGGILDDGIIWSV